MTKLEDLQRRVEVLEQARFQETHQHTWRYSKHVTHYLGGDALFWSWECTDEKCDYGSGGTNHRGGLPDHFPNDLR
jgi:hypothetical protein